MFVNIYVGNLSYQMTDEELKDTFGQFGEVSSAKIIVDKFSQRSKGFGFVEMDDEGAKKAIDELNGKEVQGRTLRVNEAKPREDRG